MVPVGVEVPVGVVVVPVWVVVVVVPHAVSNSDTISTSAIRVMNALVTLK